ncbi:TetR/AcrR family transcriptional regulator [Nocardioides humilatus]|uniref:TetR/AcrR family transcriptional regulator n=1 Tax=Nocardioides humilatus TaxID=2607660 RepID=A0A5B1L944_9ACTN|nr:TetR/AcrR family transcriptional regulator [Nocardioides humilatus]KAA1416946.1 TetR/AcrR family transcriptional regulator [Nocardioides humilatus]
MTSRLSDLIEAPAADPATTEILDAALAIFTTLGIRKTNIEDIARQAGVDRVTVYRRLGTKNDIVNAVLAREAQRVFERAAASAGKSGDVDERVALIFTGLVGDLRGNALFNKLMSIEPDTTFPKVSRGAGDLLRLAVDFATTILLPDVESDDPDALTARIEIVARLVHSLFLTPDAAVELKTRQQLLRFARKYVVPIVTG